MNEKSNFFASAQCLGYNLEKGIALTQEICYPPEANILKQTEKKVKQVKPTVLYIAADGDDMIEKFQRRLAKKYQLRVLKYEQPAGQTDGEAAHIDLFILSIAQNAIVNCPSSFSAFAKRQRDARGKSTDFWGVENEPRADEVNTDL